VKKKGLGGIPYDGMNGMVYTSRYVSISDMYSIPITDNRPPPPVYDLPVDGDGVCVCVCVCVCVGDGD
jgi:hypothetical protein